MRELTAPFSLVGTPGQAKELSGNWTLVAPHWVALLWSSPPIATRDSIVNSAITLHCCA